MPTPSAQLTAAFYDYKQVYRDKIDCASNAAAGNTIVAAVTGKRICVLACKPQAAADVDITWYSGAADTGTKKGGTETCKAGGGYTLPAPPDPAHFWLETEAGEALTLLLSAAVQVSGPIVYFLRP